MKTITLLLLAACAVLAQIKTAGTAATAGTTQASASQPAAFNAPALTTNTGVVVSAAHFGGSFPTIGGQVAAGYQGAIFSGGKMIFTPYVVNPGATQINQGTILSYNGGPGGTFNCTDPTTCAANYSWFDMTTLTPFCPSGFGACPSQDSASGYTCGGVVDNNGIIYYIPGATQQFPVMMSLNPAGSGGITNASNYKYFSAPSKLSGSPLGSTYGWCTGVFDGRYVYYAPTLGGGISSSNFLRYDTQAGSWPASFVIANFSHFDISTATGGDANCCFESSAFDGHQNIYLLPTTNPSHGNLVIYNTQGAGFTSTSSYKSFDLANLGTVGNPQVTGSGNLAAVQTQNAYIGGQMVWVGTTEYMYGAPWASNPGGTGHADNVLLSTVFRVPVATCSVSATASQTCSGTFTALDITDPSSIWEIYDLSSLTTNQAWTSNGFAYPALFPASSPLANQLTLGGFQLTWLNTHNSADPIVGMVADYGSFYVRHHASGSLSDPSAWDVIQRPAAQFNGCMGGAYDPVNQLLGVSCPNMAPAPEVVYIGPV